MASELSEQDLVDLDRNIVLWGTPTTNRHLAQLFDGTDTACELTFNAADRNSEIMHARSTQGTRIFSRFWIDILMNNDLKCTYDFERALHENMNYVLIDADPRPTQPCQIVTSM